MDERLELDALLDEIKDTEQKLSNLRKEYRERKTAGFVQLLKRVMKQIKFSAKLRAIGYRDPLDFWRGRAL